jgi:hypothetical protein
MSFGSGPDRDHNQPKTLEETLIEYGRVGGPTEHGWHTFEPMFHCWRRYHLSSNAKRNGKVGKALAVGTIFHEFMAIHYAPYLKDGAVVLNGGITSLYDHLAQNGFTEEASEAFRLYEGYKNRYDGNDGYLSKDVEIVAVEQLVERSLPWGDPYTIRLDLVLRLPDGYWIADHKTAWARTTEFIEGWQIDPSVLGMLWAAQEKYSPLRGASINGVIKTRVPDYDRFTFAYDTKIIADWLRMMEYKTAEKRIAQLAGWPPNFRSCFGKYGRCGFFEQCVYGLE